MRGLEYVLVLLVPLGVWVFSTIFRGNNERQAPRPGSAPRPSSPRRPVTDLDRFLEEARRRREAAERGQTVSSEPVSRPAPPREVRPAPPVERRPVRANPPVRRRNVETAPPRPARAPVMLEPVAEAPTPSFPPPRVEAPRPEPVRVEASPPPPAPPASQPAAAALTPMPRPAGSRRAQSPMLVQLADLLRSPRAAGTAVVLKEIFDRPLSQRRRRV
jgi:hypothetical protein